MATMTTSRLRDSALIVVCAALLFGAAPAAADPTETTAIPTPVPSEGGPIHRSPDKGGANAPVQTVPAPPAEPCFSCHPNQISESSAAPVPGPPPTVAPPELTGSNSGVPAKATNLVIWGDHFHPGGRVYMEVRGNDGTLIWHKDDVKPDAAGHVNVTTSRGTDSSTPVNAYAQAIDPAAGDTARLPVAVIGGPPGPVQP
jgi:hypothetical protein